MEEQSANKILSSEKFTKFNISYPVIVKGWEVCQGQRYEQRYLSIHFQKISDEILAFKINVTCLNSYDEVIEEYKDISIKDVIRKNVNFFENITLAPNTEKVFVSLRQYVLTDATVGPLDNDNEIVEYEFRRFEDGDDEQAAAQLVPSAKGYPIENGSHWYCACGKLNWKHSDTCSACKSEKNEVFKKINENAIEREKQKIVTIQDAKIKSKLKRKKTTVSVVAGLVTFAILICILCATVIPLPSVTVKGLKYEINDNGGYTVTACNTDEQNIVIPSKIRGKNVNEIGFGAFNRCENLTTIELPDTIINIDDYAFSGCVNLTSVNIPDNVIRLGDGAFSYCKNLTELTVPSSVKYMGLAVFTNSPKLTVFFNAKSEQENWSVYTYTRKSCIWNHKEHGKTNDGFKWV
ncbi:MAG: leucine-rich repeat domain-containing protein, partial [Clostridia bacterium]|nr:leucine-rich repeat domain-containing protein [Clostridia bacterium]